MIFFMKSKGLYDAASLTGVYFFTVAVLLMILAYACLRGETQLLTNQTPTAPPIPDDENNELQVSTLRNVVLSFLIIVATVCFALGITLPVIKFTTIFVWTNEHSITTVIYALFKNQEFFLCGVIFIFSIVFPFMKLFYLLTLVTSPDISPEFRKKSMCTMEWLGRYSMTDVMVLALIIFYMNSSAYTEANVLPGAYLFAASALMTIFAYGWANSLTPVRIVCEKRN